ncbi:MAG TPA: response regulator [Flavobacterium sp.]|nr:response regulator [Flavobacterium sp.]
MAHHILIIDDDSRNIFALSAVLKSRGFSCQSCSGAKEAIEFLSGNHPIDVILMDMMMPEMDGYEAIPIIRNLTGRKKTPIISVTAQAMVGDREKCLAVGADDYLSKPIDVDRLMQLLNHY